MIDGKRRTRSMTTAAVFGVALSGADEVAVGRFVHHETSEWALTSDHPVDRLSDDVYADILPGRLGTYVYPSDVRFHLKNRRRTVQGDLDAAVSAERVLLHRERALNMNHLTVVQNAPDEDAVFVPNQEEGGEEDEDEENCADEEEDEDGDGVAEEVAECLDTDEESEM